KFGWQGEQFLLDGKPFLIRSGSMHYPRVPRAYWRDRMRKMKAMGLNTLCSYIFWNLHEPQPGRFDFSGNLDVADYLRTAQEEGLWAIIRPGPYICSEWEFGGFPAWLLATPEMKVRSSDSRFLKAAASYIQRVGEELAPLQITHGGPVIMAQVENEYGSFGDSKTYLNAIRDMIRAAGFDVTLYTSDGPNAKMLAAGTLPGVLSAIYFGGSDAVKTFANFAKFRQHVPHMCGEYWIGWFDHWGEVHHVTSPQESAKGLDWMLSHRASVNLYMFHGGTSFGFMSGANYGRAYQPDVTSYDYDAPLDEAGRPREKFFVLRDVIRRHLPSGERLPALPAPLPVIEIPRFELKQSAAFFAHLGRAVTSKTPKPMEALGQAYGFILYRTQIDAAIHGVLEIIKLRDHAWVYQGKRKLGVLDRRLKQDSLEVDIVADEPLDILVENMGRINFGPQLPYNHKGITTKVLLNGKELTGWTIFSLPLTSLSNLAFSAQRVPAPAFYRDRFVLESTGDTFLDMRGWGMGCVWVNGHNLGRYWKIGPQQSLFVPGCWLNTGENEIIVLDLEEGHHRSAQGRGDPVYQTMKQF
ncbi:MAG: beta-galactosidase, partial [Terriglobia bacterium]